MKTQIFGIVEPFTGVTDEYANPAICQVNMHHRIAKDRRKLIALQRQQTRDALCATAVILILVAIGIARLVVELM